MTGAYCGERKRRDLHRLHCGREGCADEAHRDTGPVASAAAREFVRGHPETEEARLRGRYFGPE